MYKINNKNKNVVVSILDDESNYDMDKMDENFVCDFNLNIYQRHDSSIINYEEFELMMELMETVFKSTKDVIKTKYKIIKLVYKSNGTDR